MHYNEITLTANRSEVEPWRIERLQRILGYVCALADHYENENLLSKIGNLHDHKGCLTVNWISDPTEDEKEYFFKAWESAIGDGSSLVEHQRI